ncbi:UNVERIFIED_ORG: collagen type I/II/III/V/XI/XXIV/XXVII alpha [Methylobacterium sp. SuP10 SLI 274]|uniref:hypothetical protein n=1 Tax=Methylorubrum extorquens TaxID=408 RepID=UPI00209DCBA3|nr:hypothetical protein [Methylorubrum extorquens]MDF9861512.1 collagen type I/II/III/V/XI/XXIV/XXVII alpha [Methylorubrum pseudosasae]MDH6635137.1 collagen type I/II/III/V/XI/XXIV/XXVII alpha [Methylobacterium sp. SuP10 SLI 274]MDH6664310.1 collagen type I/II/III/V/XI/XXIV/XXVII alpha [Methylorubrum zatmanii]MCP1561311.1 hypothetical protein [Methylorubrum extorquens]MDF9789804.1 collagen type I/II/III/V/XI/XXIV/XXVII alpha [Methylorubrum extorquens]
MSTVIPFFRPASARQGNWSQQELAEFYRVEAALLRAGFSIASEHGLSDEGEPWFVFCQPDGDAIIHFAKIDGNYLIASDALDRPVRGTDFRTLIDQIARLHPHLLPIPATGTGTTLVVHPAALLAALVAAAALSLSSEDAHAGPLVAGGEGVSPPPTSQGGEPAQGHPQPKANGGSGDRDTDRKQLEAIILSAMIFAAEAMAIDHRAVSAELDLDFADGAGNASILTAQGEAASASGTTFGPGRGSVSAQPAVLTAQGSGANPDARPHPASDTIAAASRVDPAPVARTESPAEAPKSPASQNQPLAPKFGSDVALANTSAEASAAKSSGQQASTSGRSESAAPASDEPGSASSDQHAGSASASITEPGSRARSAPAASSDSADAGSGPARPAWVNAVTQTATNRAPSPEASRDADDRGDGRPAEAALGNSPKVEPAGHANGHVEGMGRDRESPAKAAETHPTGEQAAPGHSQPEGAGRGAPAETATGNSPQAERGAESDRQATSVAPAQSPQVEPATGTTPQAGQARPDQSPIDSTGQDRGAPAMAAVGHSPNAEPVGPGQGQASAQSQDQGAPAAASHEMRAEPTSPTNGPVNTVGPDRASSPEGASGNNPQTAPAGGGNGQAGGVARQEPASAQAEAANSPSVEASSRGNTGAVAQERGPQAEPATGSNPPSAQTGRGQDQSSVVARQDAGPAQAEAANSPPVESSSRGNAGAVAQERGPQAEPATGSNPLSAQTGRGQDQSSGVAREDAAPAQAEAANSPPVEASSRGSGNAGAAAQERSPQAEPATGSTPPSAQTDRGHDQSSAVAREETVPAQAETRNSPPVEQTGRDNGNASAVAQDRGSQAEPAVAQNPPIGRTGPNEGHAGVSGPGSARAEAVTGDPLAGQQGGRASGQENANDQGSPRPTEAASGNDPQIEPTGSNNGQGQGHGSNSKAEVVALHEPSSDAPTAGHGRAPSDASERGSAAQAEAVLPATEQQADRGQSQNSVPAERNDQQAPEAHGPGATDTASSHGKPETAGETRSDAAPAPKAHALLDPDSASHGSKTLSATELPGGAHEPTDAAAPGPAAKADRAPAADGPGQDLTSSSAEPARGHSIEHGSDQAANAAASEQTNGDVFGTKEHGSTPSDVAVTLPSNVPTGGAGPQARPAQEESAPHGQSADAELAVPASAAHDPVLQDRGSDRAEAENPLGHGASPASDAQIASPKGEHAQADPDGPHDGAGPVVVRAIPVADPQATVHGVDENDLSGPSGGPDLTSPSAPVSQEAIAPAHFDQGQVDDGLSVSSRTDREAPGQAAPPVKANEPTQPPVQVEADLAGGPLPNSQSGSAASQGASGQAKPGRPSPPPAVIDADGNLVFHTDAPQDPAPSAPPQGPDEATTHHTVGLIGVTDQTHPVHDMYHHT